MIATTDLNDIRKQLREKILAADLSLDQQIVVWSTLELDLTLQSIQDELHDLVRNTQDTRI